MAARALSASRESEYVERSRCEAVGLPEGEVIWSSRKVLEAICGSSGARGALREAGELLGDGLEGTAIGLMAGMLVRLYAEAAGFVGVEDGLSGGRSRFDKNIEGSEVDRQLGGGGR